ncbi:serine dehydratase, partial [Acinetobacter pittii]
AFTISKNEKIISLTVTDKEALSACFMFLDNHRTLVEPACGVQHKLRTTFKLLRKFRFRNILRLSFILSGLSFHFKDLRKDY